MYSLDFSLIGVATAKSKLKFSFVLMDDFYRWLLKEGIDVKKDPLIITELPGKGRCGFATEYLYPGDILLTVPEKLFITLDKAHSDELTCAIFKEAPSLTLPAQLSTFLLKEKALGSESFWAPYFNVLPTHYTAMVNWTLEDEPFILRHLLKEEWKLSYVDDEKQYKAFLEGVQSALTIETKHIKTLERLQKISRKEFMWALGTVHTRTCHYETEVDPKSEVGALIPYLDFMNHDFTDENPQRKIAYFTPGKDCYQIKSGSGMKPGDEVLICYAHDSDTHFAKYYGFIPSRNPYDNIKLEADLPRTLEILGGGKPDCDFESVLSQEMINELQKYVPGFIEVSEVKGKKGQKDKKVFRPLKKVEFFFNMAPPEMNPTLDFFSRACSAKKPKTLQLAFHDSAYFESTEHFKTSASRLRIAFADLIGQNYGPKPKEAPKTETQKFLAEFHEAELAKLNLILENI